MKHRITVVVPVEKKGLFGITRTVTVKRTVEVDGKTYRKIMRKYKRRPYSVEEMMLYDEIFNDG